MTNRLLLARAVSGSAWPALNASLEELTGIRASSTGRKEQRLADTEAAVYLESELARRP